MTSWPAGVGREILGELDSTNAEALRRAAAGAAGTFRGELTGAAGGAAKGVDWAQTGPAPIVAASASAPMGRKRAKFISSSPFTGVATTEVS